MWLPLYLSGVMLFLLAKGATLGDDGNLCLNCDHAIENLREYLKIVAMHPDVNYDESIEFLIRQAASLGLPYTVTEVLPDKPVLVMTWAGSQPELPSILLNSHMDVVPVFEDSWVHPPFDAHIDEDGVMYGRGIQDMKSMTIQYLEAVRRLKEAGVQLKRTVHLTFVPDEEIGGKTGMALFVKTEIFNNLNIGFSMDEGQASQTEKYNVFYAERTVWQLTVHCQGKSGHGSLLHENTAGEKIQYIINKFLELREENKKLLESDPSLTTGDVTTINLTKLSGGIQTNVVPEEFTATFDIRISLNQDLDEFYEMIQRWCAEAGEGVSIEFIQKDEYVPPTKLDDSNPYWIALEALANQINITLSPRVLPGATDSRYILAMGTPALGFSPMINTPLQLHEHNESLRVEVFLDGIGIYEKIIPALANS